MTLVDISDLVTACGGDAAVSAFYDYRANVTGASVATAWDDARGGGFGVQLLGVGTTKPAIGATGLTTDGVDNGFESGTSNQFDWSLGRTLIYVGTLEASNGWAVSINDNPVTKSVGIDCRTAMKFHTPVDVTLPTARSATMRCASISRSITAPYTGVPSSQQCQFMVHGRIGSGDRTGGDKYHLDQTTVLTSGSWRLSVGNQAGVSNTALIRAVIVLSTPMTGTQWAAISAWAESVHSAVPDRSGNTRLLACHGNSIMAGFTAGTGNAPPDLIAADPAWNTNLDYISGGLNSLPGSHLLLWDPVKIHPALKEAAYTIRGYLWLEGTVDLFAGVTGAQQAENARLACAAAKAAGATFTVAGTQLPRFNLNGAQEIQRLACNTALRAMAGTGTGIDRIADIAAIPLMSDPNNTTYYTDGIHPSGAGQQLCAPIWLGAIASALGNGQNATNRTIFLRQSLIGSRFRR